MKRLDDYWYSDNSLSRLLTPLGWLFCLLVAARRFAYRIGALKSVRLPVAVIVVGNITVGGTGKTPLVIWLAKYLSGHGYRPGIISRGYGGQSPVWPLPVEPDSDAGMVGDEPVLIAGRTGCPVVVGPDRVAAANYLLARHECDVVLSDDGMQHYRLARDIEIGVLDGERRLGNGRCLPAGPLREPRSRLSEVDFIVSSVCADGGAYAMSLRGTVLHNLASGESRAVFEWREETVHAVAGIGNPARFFETLRQSGLKVIEHPFPDHYPLQREDLDFDDGYPVLLTEKDAVKCRSFARDNYWYLPVDAILPERLGERIRTKLRG